MQPYCRYCGVKKESQLSPIFDGNTGEPDIILQCMNPHCRVGCSYRTNGRHNFKRQGFLWLARVCQNCQYTICGWGW